MKNLTQIVELKEGKLGLFKAKSKEASSWYIFLSKVFAYFIEENEDGEYITRYLDENRELIGKSNDVVKCVNLWNTDKHFTIKQLCTDLEEEYYAVDTIGFAPEYLNGEDSSNLEKYYINYRTKNVLDYFEKFGAIIDKYDDIKKIKINVCIGYDTEDEDTNDILCQINIYNLDYSDSHTYKGKYHDLRKDDDIKVIRKCINRAIETFIEDIKTLFGQEICIVFDEPRKNAFDCYKGDDENFSRLEDLVFEDIKNKYVVEKE